MFTINALSVVVPKRHRAVKPHKLAEIRARMERSGYNVSFPITLEGDKVTLVDGNHRLEAAKLCGISEIPYVIKPDGVLSLAHSVRCNSDQTLGSEDDVFDLAEYCWGYAQDGWMGQQIAEALGISPSMVSNYSNIKAKLHPRAWELARFTKNPNFGNQEEDDLVNQEFTIVNWRESYFRALLKPLSWQYGDNTTMRSQMRVICEASARFANDKEKVTASWIGELAETHAWHIKLKRYAVENLKPWVGLGSRKKLFANINLGIFGNMEDESTLERFKKAIDALNGKAPQLIHGLAEDLSQVKNESVDLIITSPPYNLGKENWPMGGQGREPREVGIGYQDSQPEDKYQSWQIECLREMYRVAKSGASLFYNHKVRQKDGKMIHPLDWLRKPDNPWIIRQEIIWDRGSTHNHCPVLFWPHDERIYWMTKGKPDLPEGKLVNLAENAERSTIWKFHGPVAGTWHPAPFPPELPRRCIEAIGRADLTVLDPFAGSCTTLKIAISEFGLEAIGVDSSRDYLKRACEENGWETESIISKGVLLETSSNSGIKEN